MDVWPSVNGLVFYRKGAALYRGVPHLSSRKIFLLNVDCILNEVYNPATSSCARQQVYVSFNWDIPDGMAGHPSSGSSG